MKIKEKIYSIINEDNIRKHSNLEKISTFPHPNSLTWGEGNESLLSFILLWILWACRTLSLLQHIKLHVRKKREEKKYEEASKLKDNISGRVNVPPIICEYYFIAWFVFLLFSFIANHFFPSVSDFILLKILFIYYLFESIAWVLYYTIFRRFFEEGYSIYHELEYLTNLMLVVPTQALCFSLLYAMPFRDMLAGLLGAGSDDTPFPVSILGALFGAIVISMIISTFPLESVRKHAPTYKMLILGNGDVVQNRLIKAIEHGEAGKKCTHEEFFFSHEELALSHEKQIEVSQRLFNKVKEKSRLNTIVWIETPTDSHYYYMKKLVDEPIPLIVVEKPLTADINELNDISNIIHNDAKRNKLFFLSYYLLEKALPLYYLVTGNRFYEKYLNIEDRPALENWRLRLGHLKQITVKICEGTDNRTWAFDEKTGGQLTETFIHNILVASLFCGSPETWELLNGTPSLKTEDSSNKVTIELNAKKYHTNIHLLMKKNATVTELERSANLEFANGSIEANFNEQSASITFNDIDSQCTIAVNDEYRVKYLIQVDLAKRVHNKECTSSEVDGLSNQIDVLKWLLSKKDSVYKNDTIN